MSCHIRFDVVLVGCVTPGWMFLFYSFQVGFGMLSLSIKSGLMR